MKAAYNPATQSASGEYTRTDYQEQRKNTAMSGGVVIAVLLVLAVIAWYFWNTITGTLKGAANALGVPDGAIPDSTVQAANSATTKDPTLAVNNYGNYYPVKTLTKADYDNMLSSLGMLEPVVRIGNVVTPPGVLDSAAKAGSEAAATVNKLGLNNAYMDLPDYQRGLVTLGEGLGKLVGVDLIQAGYDMRGAITTSATNQPMSPDSAGFLGA